MLKDSEPRTRLEMVRWVEANVKAEDKAPLLLALDEPDENVARHAARALIKLGDGSVAPTLREKAMKATNRDVAEEFNEAATRLGG